MTCKKCKKEISDESIYCMWCGVAQKRDKKKAMYQRPDGLYEKVVVIGGKREVFRGKSEPEVYRKMAAYEEKQAAGRTFQKVAEEWKEQHFKTLSPTTARGYSPAFDRAVDNFGDRPVKSILPQEIKSFIDLFAAKGRAKKTVTNQLLVLNMIFKHAGLYDGLTNNPTEFVKVPKGLAAERRAAPCDSDIAIIKRSVNVPFGLFAYLILYSGCRKGEALALQYRDIDRPNSVIHISKSVYTLSNKPIIKFPKTNAGIRAIPLLDVLLDKIPDGKPSDYIFGGSSPLTRSSFERAWEGYVKATRLQCTPHQLRHQFATTLYEAGTERKDAQEIMGHADIHTTENIYTHISKAQQRRVLEKLNDFTKNTQDTG